MNILRIIILTLTLFSQILNAQWVKTNCPDNWPISSLVNFNNKLIAGTSGGGIIFSEDDGLTWTSQELTDKRINSFLVTKKLYAGTAKGIYKLSDNGIDWDTLGLSNINVTSLAEYKSTLYAGTDSEGVFISQDDGENWNKFDTTLVNHQVSTLFTVNNIIYAGTVEAGLWRSEDNTRSWTQISNGLPGLHITSALVLDNYIIVGTDYKMYRSSISGEDWEALTPSIIVTALGKYNDYIFASSASGGFLLSSDNGNNWEYISDGFTGQITLSILVHGHNIYSATGTGLWKRPLTEIITAIDNESENFPNQFSLDQNYPNPFNPTTTIKFSVADAFHASKTHVTLKIYDLLGNEIKTLVNEQKQPGVYEVTFDGSNLSSGVYFYSFNASPSTGTGQAYNQTKKLILMK